MPGSEAIQRYWPNEGESHDLVRSDNGMFVFYADHKRIVNHLELGYGQERTALRAEITQLREDLKTERARTAPVSAAVAERDREWETRIEEKAQDHDRWAEIDEKESRVAHDDYFRCESFSMRAARHRTKAEALRSLLPPVPEIPGFEGTRGQVDGLVEAALAAPAATTNACGKSTTEGGVSK